MWGLTKRFWIMLACFVVLFLAYVAYLFWECFLHEYPPLTYQQALESTEWVVPGACRGRRVSPCDFVMRPPSLEEQQKQDAWEFYFTSKTHPKGLTLRIYNDGEVDAFFFGD